MYSSNPPSSKPPRKPARNYFARGEQLRLLMLVGSLGLVIMLMARAADPQTWKWIAPDNAEVADQSGDGLTPVPAEQIRVPRRAVAADNGTEGEFRMVADRRPATPYTLGSKKEEAKNEAKTERWATDEALANVEDSSPFRSVDFDAWAQIFDRLTEANAKDLSAENAPPAQFSQLFQQSNLYRGKLVTVSGTIRRCVKLPPNPLDERAGNLWQMWLFSGADSSPMVVYCMNLPEGFPVGNEIHQKVSFQAVYFKKWVYAAKGGTMTAPLLLARNVNWQAAPSLQREITSAEIYAGIAGTFVVAIGIVGFVWWNSRHRDSQVEQMMRQRNRQQFEQRADEISVGASVRDQLGELSAQMKKTSSTVETDEQSPS
ncbi:hypothetical protein AB1L30_16815 [Bremerella sp. JC817]|uniref:hypothetical protein n=1 Tax=Bremerella sp. JC817 TaxID=3231756 RepID=UPI00345ACD48